MSEKVTGVYFIQAENRPDDPIKIGHSEDVLLRLKNHQCGSPQPLTVLAVLPYMTPDVEKRLHDRFRSYRLEGEWFTPNPLLRRLIAGEADFLIALVNNGNIVKIRRDIASQSPTSALSDAASSITALAAEQAARIRAAIAYSGRDYRDIAKQIGVSYATFRRRASRTAPTGASSDELYAIADICGVPRAFMDEGFASDRPVAGEPSLLAA